MGTTRSDGAAEKGRTRTRYRPSWRTRTSPIVTMGSWLGAGLLIWSAVIHLHLWSTGYRHIATIGPLFLLQGVLGIVLAVGIAVVRRPLALAAGALFAVGTIGGLLLSVNVGLFGFQDSLSAPFAVQSLVVEIVAALVLGVTATIGRGKSRLERRT